MSQNWPFSSLQLTADKVTPEVSTAHCTNLGMLSVGAFSFKYMYTCQRIAGFYCNVMAVVFLLAFSQS